MSDLHIGILGGGSVGLCLAASFAKAGARVSLFVRKSSVEPLAGKPLLVKGLLGEYEIPAGDIAICDAADPGADGRHCDMLVVTTKAYDVESSLLPFSTHTAGPDILLLQNGMGAAEIARDVLGPGRAIYSTAMMIGMVRKEINRIDVSAYASPIKCGPLLGDDTAALDRMIHVSKSGFVPMIHDPHIRETVSFKLLFNSCMNPTGAIVDKSYGELLENPDSREFIVGLADETLAAFAKAYDYRPAKNGRDYVENALSDIVFPRSQGHRSSMVQDIEAGRKTEIDFLNGAVVRLAESVGLPAPRHESLISLIRAREV